MYKASIPTGTVKINGGAAVTGSPNVDLELTASDTYYSADDLEMRVSNYSDQHDSTWVAFDPEIDWTLLTGNGNRTVYVQFRDPLGNTSSNKVDTIYLDMAGPTGSVAIQGGPKTTAQREVPLVLKVSDRYTRRHSAICRYPTAPTSPGAPCRASSRRWTGPLPSGSGEKTVYVRYMDPLGNMSAAYSTKIFLDTGAGPKWYLAEGTTAWGFTTYITIANPNNEASPRESPT